MDLTKTLGRPAIEESRYHAQIEAWLNDGHHIDSIKGTALQKVVGGNYRKTCEILEAYKAGYEQKEAQEMPELPEDVRAESMQYLTKIASLFRNADLADKNKQAEDHQTVIDGKNATIEVQTTRIDELIESEISLKEQLANATAQLAELTRQHGDLGTKHTALLETHRKDRQELDQKCILVDQQAIRIDEKDQRIGGLESEKGKLQDDVSNALERVEGLESEARGYIAASEKAANELGTFSQLTQDHESQGKQYRSSELELGKTKTKVESLQQEVKNLTELLKQKTKAVNKTGNK